MNVAIAKIEAETTSYLDRLDDAFQRPFAAELSYVSMFCGGGGLDLGFASAGFRPLFSSDVVDTYCRTIADNLPGHICEAHDITELDGADVVRRVGEVPDIVIGGPPCQSFSILGARGSTNDPRGKLALEYARFISEVKPRAFLFENVPGLTTLNGGADWAELRQYYEQLTGYNVRWTKLNSVQYGVPQIRQRIIAIGFRDFNNSEQFEWPDPTHSDRVGALDLNLDHPVTAREALGQVEGLPNHVLRVHSERVATRYSTIPQGGRDRKDHTDRIHPDKPSGTVLVGSGAGGGRPFIHPDEHRHITVREAARLQSFPDWWEFAGGPTASYRQVGNAVPPLMAKAIAEQLLSVLR